MGVPAFPLAARTLLLRDYYGKGGLPLAVGLIRMQVIDFMAPRVGLEPTTNGLTAHRVFAVFSANLSNFPLTEPFL